MTEGVVGMPRWVERESRRTRPPIHESPLGGRGHMGATAQEPCDLGHRDNLFCLQRWAGGEPAGTPAKRSLPGCRPDTVLSDVRVDA